jgi:hypothetical protein
MLRGAILGALTRKEGAPYFFEITDAGMLDVEARGLGWLEAASTGGGVFAERLRALAALRGFAGTEPGDRVIDRVRDALKVELGSARTAAKRDQLRKLVAILGPSRE